MTVGRQMETEEQRQFWRDVEQSAREVERWPAWLRGVAEEEDHTPVHHRCDAARQEEEKLTAVKK
ncbi:hypothetical protein EG829_26750 [bacterium]|nr:hypothetical protein [bacterium]